MNHRICGSIKNKEIIRRNNNDLVIIYKKISIFNEDCHPFLEAGFFALGAFINNENVRIVFPELLFTLAKTIIPSDYIKNEIYNVVRIIKLKFKNTCDVKLMIEKLNLFLSQTKGHISKIY